MRFRQAMASNEYHLVTDWRVEGTVEEVSAILSDAASLPRWWPSVYLTVNVLEPGREDGTQKVLKLHTRGWLPYTLDWILRVTESRRPYGFTLEAEGDLNGRGVWTFVQAGTHVLIHYDWRIRADKLLLQALSFAFKLAFAANHRWAMERGGESLRLELARRRARSPDQLACIPAPPGPARVSARLLWIMLALVVLAVVACAIAVLRSPTTR